MDARSTFTEPWFSPCAVFSTQRALEFVVMHCHSCLSGGRGGRHKEGEEEEYEGVYGCRL